MNPIREAWRTFTWPIRIAVLVVTAGIVLGAVLWAYNVATAPQRAAQAQIDARTQRAATDAARVAIDAITSGEARNDEIEEKVDDAIQKIRALPPEQRDDAAIRTLCMFESARGDPACERLLQPRAE